MNKDPFELKIINYALKIKKDCRMQDYMIKR